MLDFALAVLIIAATHGAGDSPAVPSSCSEKSLVFCDDFEDDDIDVGSWEIRASEANTVELTTERAAHGRQSVHIHAENGFGFLRLSKIFPIEGDRYWARMFLRVERFSTVPWAHWTVAEAAGDGDDDGSLIRVGGQFVTTEGVNRWGVGSDLGPTGDWTIHDQDPPGAVEEPPARDWICLEWTHDAAADRGRLFVDGVEHPSLATSRDRHGGEDVPFDIPCLHSVWFGWWQYQPDPKPFDVWIDDIAIDHDRIGCGR